MSKNLSSARALYLEGIRDGNVRATVEKYTGHRYTQHSTGVRDGIEGFVEFFGSFVERNSKREIEILRGVEDGRYAFIHAYQSLNDGAYKWVTMDLFDTDAEGSIIEHWDVIQPYSESAVSGVGMVDGETEITDLERTDENKELVLEYTKQVLQEQHPERVERFVVPDLIQHSLSMPSGRAGLETWLSSDESGDYEMLFKLIGQGNFVATLGKRHAKGKDLAVMDLYRIDEGSIAEHWDAVELIPSRAQWRNTGKF